MDLKGLILAGGKGTRLGKVSERTNKHLLPVWNKPMIFYPLQTLLDMGIKKICIIVQDNVDDFIGLLGDGSKFGKDVEFYFRHQPAPSGIAEAINRCETFVENEDDFMVILGDNLFTEKLSPPTAMKGQISAHIWLGKVDNPNEYGNPSFATEAMPRIYRIVEKPFKPLSPYAVTGAYYFSKDFFPKFKEMKPSNRGEYEVTDVLNAFLPRVTFTILQSPWFDLGSHERLFQATKFLKENKNGQ
jgi:glucose-1-phosphate thymidylyltransferase